MTTLIGEKNWEKTITNLSAGRYIFGTSGWGIGVVTAIKKGNTTITVKDENGNYEKNKHI